MTPPKKPLAGGGIEEAAKLLKELGGEIAEKLIHKMAAIDPAMTDKISESLEKISFSPDMLLKLTPKEVSALLKEVKPEELGLVLRLIPKHLEQGQQVLKWLMQFSSSIIHGLESGLNQKMIDANLVKEAHTRVFKALADLIAKGVISDPRQDDPRV